MECRVSAFSRIGGRERNEDACGYLEVEGIVCCVLADGAGGHGGGDVASRLSVQSVLNDFVASPKVSAAALMELLHNANQAVLLRQQSDAAVADMRSTLVVLIFDPAQRTAVWGHVGDSRLYLFRNGSKYLRTHDHSLVQTMVDNGLISSEEAATHRERNILIASIGSREDFSPTVTDQPFALQDGDALFLCSDGVWGVLEDQCIEKYLGESTSAEDWLNRVEQSIGAEPRPGADNYSAVGVWCGEVDGMMRTIPA